MTIITKEEFINMIINNGSSPLMDIDESFDFDLEDYHSLKNMKKSALIFLYMEHINITPDLMEVALSMNETFVKFLLYFFERKWVTNHQLIHFVKDPDIIDTFVLEGSSYGPREREISSLIIDAKEKYIKNKVMKGVPEILVKKVLGYLELPHRHLYRIDNESIVCIDYEDENEDEDGY